jgi:DNA-binding Xre family transcriptional regulator
MKPKPPAATTLERFLRKNKLKPVDLADEANISRQHLHRIRKGEADPGILTAVRIRDACSRLLWRVVGLEELFSATDPQAVRIRAKRKENPQ